MSPKQNENLFLDNSITQAEDERTVLAKGNQINTQRLAIDSAHTNINEPAIGLTQRGCNAAYSLGTTISQTFKKSATTSTSDSPSTTKYTCLAAQKHQSW
jgi:hypothetical protein